MTCPCPLSVGTLLAASAICSNSRAPGGPRIGRELAAHARKHALLATGCPESAEQAELAPMDAPTSQSPTAPNFAPHTRRPDAQPHRRRKDPGGRHVTLICPCCASTDVCGVEYPAIYDGVLVWQCEHCLHAWPRWHDGKRGKAASELADHINGYDQEDQ